jgi:tRNA/tmRNA/rRNA uracil-C5-methylase (TrmA/RlmC/RlmD family)
MDYVTTKGRFGLRMRGRWNYVVELDTCHLIPPDCYATVRRVWEKARELDIPDYHVRTHEGFLRYLVVRRSPQDELLLAAVAASSEAYTTEMEQLAAYVCEQPTVRGFHWLLNDALTDLSFGTPVRHWGDETLPMGVDDGSGGDRSNLTLHIGPNTFFQNNVHLLLPMLEEVEAAVAACGATRIADLYGGVGLIALFLAQRLGNGPNGPSNEANDGENTLNIVTVESNAESVELARRNIAEHPLPSTTAVTAVEAETLAFLREQPVGAFDCIVVDPPRTGLEEHVCAELRRIAPRRIVYVSCNALTQHCDIHALLPAYRISLLRGYDMFPQTPHVEMVAVLDAK